jgi:peptide/nickel transport system permease protein
VTQYLLKRIGLALLTLVILSLIIFFAGAVLPGNPGRAILGPFASQHAVEALNRSLGVDRPLASQYWGWASGFIHGDMGMSYQFRAPVSSFVLPALGRSLKLAAVRRSWGWSISGLRGGRLYRGRAIDRTISVAGLSSRRCQSSSPGCAHRGLRDRAEGLRSPRVLLAERPRLPMRYLILPAIPLC